MIAGDSRLVPGDSRFACSPHANDSTCPCRESRARSLVETSHWLGARPSALNARDAVTRRRYDWRRRRVRRRAADPAEGALLA